MNRTTSVVTTSQPGTTATGAARRGSGWRIPLLGTSVRPRAVIVTAVLGLLVVVVAVIGLMLGDYPLSPSGAIRALLGEGDFAVTVVREWRLPRVLAAVCFGAALAVAGAVFQSLTRNPLGSPDVIGFATGAYTGALVVMTVVGTGYVSSAGGALVGGVLTALVVYGLAYKRGMQGFRLIIVGIAVTAVLHSVNLYLLLRAETEVSMAASIWGAGSISLVGWPQLLPALLGLALTLPGLLLVPSLRQLELGDDAAAAHGLRVEPARLGLVLYAVALVAMVTATAGPIAFVALAAPQIARRLVGGTGIPVVGSAVTGALVLLGADLVAAHVVATDVPVGMVTVVLGGTYLIALLIKEARSS